MQYFFLVIVLIIIVYSLPAKALGATAFIFIASLFFIRFIDSVMTGRKIPLFQAAEAVINSIVITFAAFFLWIYFFPMLIIMLPFVYFVAQMTAYSYFLGVPLTGGLIVSCLTSLFVALLIFHFNYLNI